MCDFKPELSKKNKYYIPKERYYELKHFCLQYPSWKLLFSNLDAGLHSRSLIKMNNDGEYDDPVYRATVKMEELRTKIHKVEQSAIDCDESIGIYILKAVTEGKSYEWLYTMMKIPCGRDMFYDRLRKFFWILDARRDN